MTVNNRNSSDIINIYSINCDICHKTIEVPIKKSEKDTAVGGIFRIVAVHQCEEETLAFLLFFDGNLALRQKVVTPVTITDINESDYVDDIQKEMFKLFGGFRFLYKKIGKEVAKILFGLITSQQVVVIGEQNEVEAVIESLFYFAEHRYPTINKWTNDILSTTDIIGTKISNSKFYPNSLIVDLEKNVVINGFSNKFCLELVEKIIHLSDITTYHHVIRYELNQIRSISQDLLEIRNLYEIDSYLATLGVDFHYEDFIEIILLITSRLNPIVAQYYRINFQSEMSLNLEEIKPLRLWIFDEQLKTKADPRLSFDRLCNYKEVNIIGKIKNLVSEKKIDLNLYEFFTPINQYITFTKSNIKVIYCFPRFDDDASIIENALKFQSEHIEKIDINSITNQLLSNLVIENWTEKLISKQIPKNFSCLMDIRKNLPKLIDQSYLESLFIETDICDDNLRSFITFVLEQLTESMRSEPKLIHKLNLYTITGIINPELHSLKNGPSLDVQYNIYLYSQETNDSSCIGIILDMFVKPQNLDYSTIIQTQMNDVFDFLIRILKFSINKFTK
ncbi:MAG: hypothetical protein FK730_02680 [Asgard group archaeon]|nr:hypothetical protein [Asgard group archaeon]